MTTRPATQGSSRTEGRNKERFRLPEPPEREPDEVTAFDHIYERGNNHHLFMHFGKPDTTLVVADKWIVASEEFNKARARRPDLLIAFDVSPEDYRASNGYIVSEQGKPPDFIMEVASRAPPRWTPETSGMTTPPWASGILALRRNGRFSRGQAGRRQAGGERLPADVYKRDSAGRPPGIQPRVKPDHPVGSRSAGVGGPGNRSTHPDL